MKISQRTKAGVLDRMTVRMGNITEIDADAIVNAANSTLLGGGGVDGMIHWAAGSGLLEECRSLGWCPAGEARMTGGHALKARHIIHAVGPVFGLEAEEAPRLLAACYDNSLALAAEHGFGTVAFPAISCGSYGYPVREACRIAIDTVTDFLMRHDFPGRVIFVLFSCGDYEAYKEYYEVKRTEIAGR